MTDWWNGLLNGMIQIIFAMFPRYRLILVKRIIFSSNRFIRQAIDYQKNYYDILGVSHNATQQEIKNAFYLLSKKVRKKYKYLEYLET